MPPSGEVYLGCLLQLLKQMSVRDMDWDLVDHVLRFLDVVIESPEGSHNPILRERFVSDLWFKLDLTNLIADLIDRENEFCGPLLNSLKEKCIELLIPPPEPEPEPPEPAAPPPPPPPPAPAAPPPPPRPAYIPPPVPPPMPPPLMGLPRPPPPMFAPRPPGGPMFGGPRPPFGAAAAPPSSVNVPKPSLKMKSLFWDKVPDRRLAQTFWASVKLPDYTPQFWKEIEQAFQQIVVKTKEKKVEEKPKTINVLDLKKLTQIGIKIARLRKPWYEMRNAILTLDPTAFIGVEDVQTVLDCAPNDEEKKTLQGYLQSGGALELLSDAERFAVELMKTQRCEARLRALLARFVIDEKANEALKIFSVHLHAIHELQRSKCFKDLLLMALAIGNFMNHGTRLGNTLGFRLKGLNKLHDTRSFDGKTTIMQEIVKELCAREHKLLSEDMEHVMSPQVKVSLQEACDMAANVEGSINQIRTQLKVAVPAIIMEVKVVTDPDGSERVDLSLIYDSFFDVMSATLAEKELILTQVQEVQTQAKDAFEKMLNFFGETPTTVPNDTEWWSDMQTFVDRVSGAMRTIYQERKDAEEREQRKRELELKRQLEEATKAEAAKQRQQQQDKRALRRNSTSMRGAARETNSEASWMNGGEGEGAATSAASWTSGRAMLRSKTFASREGRERENVALREGREGGSVGSGERESLSTRTSNTSVEDVMPTSVAFSAGGENGAAGGLGKAGAADWKSRRESKASQDKASSHECVSVPSGPNAAPSAGGPASHVDASAVPPCVADAPATRPKEGSTDTGTPTHSVRFRLPVVPESPESAAPTPTTPFSKGPPMSLPNEASPSPGSHANSTPRSASAGLSSSLTPRSASGSPNDIVSASSTSRGEAARTRSGGLPRGQSKDGGEGGGGAGGQPSPRPVLGSGRLGSRAVGDGTESPAGTGVVGRRRTRSQSQGDLGALADSMLELEVKLVLENIVDELQMKELLGEL